ncbi:30S ribosomal protein S12 methylthiotransferase RimO [Carboxylicivirga mesophila]|uniref:Ribosomal protein uS12 methylthiotransferase RimO n=1 Tax=Carboxylicivirga mesophila TaxID=1166478 RepID=A0ABS5K8L7_9BACT|nr:30S ribosomal protein S12 methylthiotransferase RimO [Carboxylicivirga mesophila]MBS2211348.1 30S ribosomal protein S12 methylthiotransferase RimO [Carboxylicivirga mesophila]
MTVPKGKKVDVVTLGCSKNLVDSEFLIRQFKANGIEVAHDAETPDGEVAIINTCGFIADAKEESIDTILEFAEAKKRGDIKQLYVMGCLSERYPGQLKKELPEVDKFYGKFDWKDIVSEIGATYRRDLMNERSLTTPDHYAYLKISEGCNRTCSYCAIPIITGKHVSRPMDDLLEEARRLRDSGVKELQVIAQDLSFYGYDLYKSYKLPNLVDELAKIDGIEWIRLHYAYPAGFPLDVLKVMHDNPKVCNYLDIALQHISDNMLELMRRGVRKNQTYRLIEEMRKQVPDIHLRTTFITGHPGETEKDFAEMEQFVKDIRFERLGVFPYSHEDDTYAHKKYKDDVPDEVKQERADRIMEIQNGIAKEINQAKIGKTLKVIIDREEGDYFIGRTEYDSPEVDQEVLLHKEENRELQKGEFYNVEITDSEDYDLFGIAK